MNITNIINYGNDSHFCKQITNQINLVYMNIRNFFQTFAKNELHMYEYASKYIIKQQLHILVNSFLM